MKQFTYVSPSTLKFDAYVSKRREEERETGEEKEAGRGRQFEED
jgi:hypothetical protein